MKRQIFSSRTSYFCLYCFVSLTLVYLLILFDTHNKEKIVKLQEDLKTLKSEYIIENEDEKQEKKYADIFQVQIKIPEVKCLLQLETVTNKTVENDQFLIALDQEDDYLTIKLEELSKDSFFLENVNETLLWNKRRDLINHLDEEKKSKIIFMNIQQSANIIYENVKNYLENNIIRIDTVPQNDTEELEQIKAFSQSTDIIFADLSYGFHLPIENANYNPHIEFITKPTEYQYFIYLENPRTRVIKSYTQYLEENATSDEELLTLINFVKLEQNQNILTRYIAGYTNETWWNCFCKTTDFLLNLEIYDNARKNLINSFVAIDSHLSGSVEYFLKYNGLDYQGNTITVLPSSLSRPLSAEEEAIIEMLNYYDFHLYRLAEKLFAQQTLLINKI